MKPEQKIMTY